VAPLMRPNIDTDAIIPSREMKRVSREGLGDGLFAGWRYVSGSGREPNPDFVLNDPAFTGASILAAGRNFGCGSSREHAVWALREYGFRVLIAPSFGAIFERNCYNNGLLPVTLAQEHIEALLAVCAPDPGSRRLSVDLERRSLVVTSTTDSQARPLFEDSFHTPEQQRQMLLEGLDPIDVTLQHAVLIESWEGRDRAQRPWVYRWGAEAVAASETSTETGP
jgi:3-isopropylmalate/(R)-2-methylmalate dehydratase small subunit